MLPKKTAGDEKIRWCNKH